MLANYGYRNGSGEYFITIDTDLCTACGDCVTACPADIFLVVEEDPNDPLREHPVVIISEKKRKKLKHECNPCKPTKEQPPLPCLEACKAGAISHSW